MEGVCRVVMDNVGPDWWIYLCQPKPTSVTKEMRTFMDWDFSAPHQYDVGAGVTRS